MTKYLKAVGFIHRFTSFAVQTCISIEDSVIMPNLFQEFLVAMSYGYMISFLILPAYENSNMNDNVFYLIYRVFSFCRYIFYLDPKVSGNIECFGYIIVLCFQLIVVLYYLLSFLSFMIERKRSKSLSLDEHLKKQSFPMKTFSYFVAYYGEILGVYLYQRFFELCLNSFNYSIQSNELTYQNSFLSLLVLITLLVYYFLRFLVAEECLTINPKNLKKLNTTQTQFFCVLIKLLIITLNISIENQATKFYLNVFLLTSLVLSQYKNQYSNLSTLRQRLIQVEFVCLAIIQSSAVILFIFRVTKIDLDHRFLVILLLTQLLVYEIMIKIWDQKVHSIFFSSNNNNHPSTIQFLIAKSIQIHENRRLDLQFYDYMQLSKHKVSCLKVHCSCRRDLTYESVIVLLHQEQVLSFNLSLQQFRKVPQINSYYLHYVSFLTMIGHSSQAFQQSNILLHKNSNLHSQQSQLQNEQTERNLQNHSQSFSQFESGLQQIKNVDDPLTNFQMLKSREFTYIERMKLQMLQEEIKSRMNLKLLVNTSKQTNNQEELSHSVNLFLSSELNNDNVKQKVIKAFQRKITFMTSLSMAGKISSATLFDSSKRISSQLLNLEMNLNKLYQQFPSQKIQSVNAFYQAELLNDFFVAYKIANVTTISDEKLLKMHQSMQINLFQNNVIFMLVGFQENTTEINIISHSNVVHKFFGYSFDQFRQIVNIQTLIPRGIRQIHSSLVSDFMIEGQSKYFREINQNLIQMANSYLKPVDFFFDINFSNQNDMTFAAFFIEQSTNNNSYLVVNQNYNITSMSQNFYQMIGFKTLNKKRSNNQNKVEYLETIQIINFPIEYLLPNFESMIEQKFYQSKEIFQNQNRYESIKLYDCDFYFLKEDVMIQISQQGLSQKDILKRIKQKWSDTNNIVVHVANMSIQFKRVEKLCYFTIEIDELMEKKDQRISSQIFKSLQNKDTTLQENKDRIEEIQEEMEEDWAKLLEFDELVIEQEEQPNMPKQLDIQEISDINDNQDESIEQNVDNTFKIKLKLMKSIDELYIENEEAVKQQQQYGIVRIDNKNQTTISKLSVKHTHQKASKQMSEQQKFFMGEVEECSESVEQLTSPKREIIMEEYQQKRSKSINLDMQEYVMMQLQVKKQQEQHKVVQIDDAASLVESLAGMRKSKFFKKYEILNRILQSNQQPQEFKVVIALLTLILLISTAFSVLVLVNVQTDLNRFVKEIDMLEIKANFLGSTYKFTLAQYIWAGYWIDLTVLHSITVPEGKKLSHFGVYNINYTYVSLKAQIDDQLSNPYLEEFFTNQEIIIGQITPSGIKYRQITFRESILMWLGLMHDYTVLIDFRAFNISIDVNQTFIVYNYANYLVFINRFQQLEVDILASTLQRTQNVQQKWNLIIIPFAILVAVLSLLTYMVYILYIKNYEKVMDVYKLIDDKSLQQDLDRLSIILGILQKDSNIMFKYQFDLEAKEKFLQSQEYKREHTKQRNRKIKKKEKRNIQKISLPKFKSCTCFMILYTIFLGYLLLIILLTDTYLTSYQPTAILYKDVADMLVAVCGVYALRETLYYQSFFFFYNSTSHGLIANEIDNILSNMNQFQQFLSQFSTLAGNYLVSDQFKQNLIYYTTHDICGLLSKDYYLQAQSFCNFSMNGVAKRGLLPTLNYMTTNLAYEQQINNFSSRPALPYKEIELPLIVSQVFTVIMEELKNGLLVITQSLISNINIICCVYLVYIMIKFLFLFTFVKKYFEQEFRIVKRFLLLVPQQTIFLEHHYERAIRLMIVQDNIA